MSASLTTSPTLRPISDFLTRHEPRFVEHADSVKASDYDVRQDAAMRAFIALQRRGIAIEADTDFTTQLEEHADISRGAIRFARYDAARKKHGDSRTSPAYRELARNYLLEDEIGETVIDPTWSTDFEEIEHEWSNQLSELLDGATPEQRQAVELMAILMQRKDAGESTSTDAIRSKLKRLRRQTGWALSPNLL